MQRGVVRLTPIDYQERPFSHLLKIAVSAEGDADRRQMFVKIFKSNGSPDDIERMLGKEREALQHFQEVLRIKPSHGEAASEARVLEQRLKGKR